jgi:hypothetical protein
MQRMELDPRTTALALARGRAVLGLVMVALPGLGARLLVGRSSPDVRALVRMLGVRDLALGVGAITTLKEQTADAEWVGMGALADGVDVVALALSPAPRVRRVGGVAVAAAAAVAGLLSARRLADARPAPG